MFLERTQEDKIMRQKPKEKKKQTKTKSLGNTFLKSNMSNTGPKSLVERQIYATDEREKQ